ncbi:GGDEF domain-containing protein [Pseudoxanthobacter soli]|nr:GGDEF domain-containing protein [Pseudoxanthobacter soli]
MLDSARGSSASRHEFAGFRRRFLITVLGAATVWTAAMVAASTMGWLSVGPLQTYNNIAFFFMALVLLVMVWRWPGTTRPAAIAFCTGGLFLIVAALFLVPEDPLRMLLFFPGIGVIFLTLGARAAWVATAVAIVAFCTAVAGGYIATTATGVSTFIISLFFTGLFFHTFRVQSVRALETIAAQNEALDEAARRDPLTSLPNLRAFRNAVEAETTAPNGGAPLAIAFVDVDFFKTINDRYGHAEGDAVLVAVAGALRGAIRAGDTVARIGGEEFAVLLPATDIATAMVVAERLRATVQATAVTIAGEITSVTVSVGVAPSRPPHASADAVLRAADLAMYAAKAQGRNRVIPAPAAA